MKKDLRKITTLPAVIDIGDDGVRVLVADMLADGSLYLRGIGEAASNGMAEGKIVDIRKTGDALKAAVKEAELKARQKIHTAHIAIADEYVQGVLSVGVAAVSDNKVSAADIETVHRVAVAGLPDSSLFVLAASEHDYEIDGRRGIRQPLGMTGRKLSGNIHLVAAQRQSLDNMKRCLDYAGIVAADSDFVFSGLAAAAAVLTVDEKELGVCLVDIGAGTTNVVLYSGGMLHETAVIPIGSDYIHRDIAQVHHVSLRAAKDIKRSVGLSDDGDEAFVNLSDAGGGGDVQVNKAVLRDTIAHRVDEILDRVGSIVHYFGKSNGTVMSAGIVFVGDGALLPGLVTMAREKLQSNARLGRILYRGNEYERVSAPRFAVGMGLLMGASASHMREIRVRPYSRLMARLKSLLPKE